MRKFKPMIMVRKALGTAAAGSIITAAIAFLGTPEGVSAVQTAIPGIPVVLLLSFLRAARNWWKITQG